MSNFGHVQPLTKEVGGKVCKFRSKLEYRWAVWCQLRKEQGLIVDWFYEDPETLLLLELEYCNNRKGYLPDFTIEYEDRYEYEETKGYFPPKDFTKIKLAAEQYENEIILIFVNLNDNGKSAKTLAQFRRAKRLEPHIKRIIYDAGKTILKPISHLFDE